jgi:uncharacterized protein
MRIGLVVIKAVGSWCNLRCRYCYATVDTEQILMPEQILKQTIKAVASLDLLPIFFWGGGEPLLAGVEFFERVLSMQARYCGGRKFVNSLQTNGTLIDRVWIDFMKRHNFQIGISWDGPMDTSRIAMDGKLTRDDVWKNIELCLEENLRLGIITVATQENLNQLPEIAKFLHSKGIKDLLFKPYIGQKLGLSLIKSSKCENCPWQFICCGGGCLHYRKYNSDTEYWNKDVLCETKKEFFDYCKQRYFS